MPGFKCLFEITSLGYPSPSGRKVPIPLAWGRLKPGKQSGRASWCRKKGLLANYLLWTSSHSYAAQWKKILFIWLHNYTADVCGGHAAPPLFLKASGNIDTTKMRVLFWSLRRVMSSDFVWVLRKPNDIMHHDQMRHQNNLVEATV